MSSRWLCTMLTSQYRFSLHALRLRWSAAIQPQIAVDIQHVPFGVWSMSWYLTWYWHAVFDRLVQVYKLTVHEICLEVQCGTFTQGYNYQRLVWRKDFGNIQKRWSLVTSYIHNLPVNAAWQLRSFPQPTCCNAVRHLFSRWYIHLFGWQSYNLRSVKDDLVLYMCSITICVLLRCLHC